MCLKLLIKRIKDVFILNNYQQSFEQSGRGFRNCFFRNKKAPEKEIFSKS